MEAPNGLIVGLGSWGARVAREYVYLLEEGALGRLYLSDFSKKSIQNFKSANAELIKRVGDKRLVFLEGDITKADKGTISKINVAHICTPNAFHYPVSKFLMGNGISLIIEKPVSEDVAEARELQEFSEKNNVVAKAGLIFRFDNSIKKIKEIYDSGKLGRVYFMRFTWEFSREPMENVDIIWDLTPHLIDMYGFFTGNNDHLFVTGLKTQFRRQDKAELASIMLNNKSKVKAILNISWFATGKNRIIEIFGDKKVLRADIITQNITLFDALDISKTEQVPVVKNNTIRDEALNLIEDAAKRSNTVNPIEIGVKETMLISQIDSAVHLIK